MYHKRMSSLLNNSNMFMNNTTSNNITMQSSESDNYESNSLPFLLKNDGAKAALSNADRRRVSFEDESQFMIDMESISSLQQIYATSVLKEENRVVSNETIHKTNDLKNKSKSLTSLTRSGDLKSLLESSSLKFSTVSEDCLSSIDDEEMVHGSLSESCTETEESIHSQQSSCTGWGQFVDFMPLEHVEPSRGIKQVFPARRRIGSLSCSSKYKHLRSRQYSSKHRRQQMKKASSMPNNETFTTASTNDIVRAFNMQLSL